MNHPLEPAKIVREARSRANLTQRELAKRAGKAQSVIARIETGKTSPTVATMNHLLASAGFELEVELVLRPVEDSHMMEDVSRILQLTPEQRLNELKNVSHFLASSKQNNPKMAVFDPN